MRVVGAVLSAAFAMLLITTAAPINVEACGTCSDPFHQALQAASVVTVSVVVEAAADGSATLQTERVLKGTAPPIRSYPPDDKAVRLTAGSHIVLMALGDTLDFRAVWVLSLAADGTLGSTQFSDAPKSLAELEALIALPETGTVEFGRPPAVPSPGGRLVAAGAALLLIAGVWARWIGAVRPT
jgi:hypothetical protein